MPIKWQNASKHDLKLLEGISILTDGRKDLLEFLLDPAQPRLRKRPGLLRDDSWGFSHGEILVVHAALDLWSGAGHLNFWDCIETWDYDNWIRFFAAISVVKGIDLKRALTLISKD